MTTAVRITNTSTEAQHFVGVQAMDFNGEEWVDAEGVIVLHAGASVQVYVHGTRDYRLTEII